MNHLNRNWNSLSDFKNYIESNTKEIVEYFDGARLITNKNNYGLAFGKIIVMKKNESSSDN